jgi:hypothetical protein
MTENRLTPEEYKNHCVTAIKSAQMGLEVALEAMELGSYPTMLDALSDAENNTQAAVLLAPMLAQKSSEKISRAIHETAELMQDFSMSLSQRYVSPDADRLAVAREFFTSQNHVTPQFEAVASMAIKVAVMEKNIRDEAGNLEERGM